VIRFIFFSIYFPPDLARPLVTEKEALVAGQRRLDPAAHAALRVVTALNKWEFIAIFWIL
jgi:hypothetical protein